MFKNSQFPLTIPIDTSLDLTLATVSRIYYTKPSTKRGYWNATVNGQSLVYNTQAGDINLSGGWNIEGYVEIGGKPWWTDVEVMIIEEHL